MDAQYSIFSETKSGSQYQEDSQNDQTTLSTFDKSPLSPCSNQYTQSSLRDSEAEYSSFSEMGSTCEGVGSMLAQKVPPTIGQPGIGMQDIIKQQPTQEEQLLIFEASENNDRSVIFSLAQSKNIDLDVPGLNEYRALHLAANEGNWQVLEALIQCGASINIGNYMERTPLHLACIRGHLRVVQVLIKHNADIHACDIDSNTPLHYATEYGHGQIVQWLLTINPDVNIKNRMGKTPADMASSREIANIYSQWQQGEAPIQRLQRNSPQRIQILDMRQQQQRGISQLDFDPIQELGKGSFGEVYLVRKRDNRQLYAMKVLRKDKIMGQNLIKYAMTERNVLSYVKHPFIVSLNFAFQTPEKLFLILDYCPGGDLAHVLRKNRRFNEETAKKYTCEVLLALEELHRRNIIFRDLKPDNIVINAQGHALLTDFGLSKEGVHDHNGAKSFCGSVAYLAPEVIKRKGHGKAVDWYLLGVLLYEMLVGVPPYYSPNSDQLIQNILNGKLKIPSGMTTQAKTLLTGLLQRDPQRRLGSGPGDAQEVKAHPFFQGVKWDKVFRYGLTMPQPELQQITEARINPQQVYGFFTKPGDESNKINGWTFVPSKN